MANFLGSTFQPTPVQSAVNLPLIKTVLDVKQGTYNATKEKLKTGLEAISALQVLRPQDSEYIQAKLSDITNKINAYGQSPDLSESFVSDDLFNIVKSAAKDPFILSAVENTQKKKLYDVQVDEIRKKNPGLYNDVNYSYGLEQAGFSDYMKGKANNLGSLNYINYTDYSKELKDFSENLDKYADVIKQTDVNGQYFVTKEGKRLTQDDLKNKVTSLLSDGAKKQMQINGWATYDQGANEEEKLAKVTDAFTKIKDSKLEKINSTIQQYELLSKNEPNNEDYKNKLKTLKTYYTDTDNNYKDIINSKNKSQMYSEAYKENVLDNFSSTFAFDNVAESYATNQGYWNEINYNYKVQKDNLDNAFKEKEFEAKYGKSATTQGVQTKADPNFAPEGEQGSFYDKQNDLVKGLETTTNTETERIYNTLSSEDKTRIDERVKASNGTLTKTDVLIELGSKSSELVSAQDLKTLDKLNLQTVLEKERFNNAIKQVTEQSKVSVDTPNMISRLASNPDIKIAWVGNDGKTRLYPAKDVLLNTGVIDQSGNKIANLSDKPGLVSAVQKSLLADKALSSGLGSTKYIQNLATLLGEDPSKIIIKGKSTVSAGISPTTGATIYDTYQTQTLDPNSKTARFLEMHKKQGGYNRAGIFSADDSFDDIPEADAYLQTIDPENIRKKVGDILAKDESLSIGKITVISPKTDAFNSLADLVGDQFDVKNDNSISIKLIPNQPNMVEVMQMQEGTSKGSPVSNLRRTTVRIEDLPMAVKSQVDFQNTKSNITFKNLPPVNVPVQYGSINDRSRLKDIAETHFGGAGAIRLAEQTTREGATNNFFSTYSNQLGTPTQPTALGQLITGVINDPSIVVKLVKGRSNDVYPQVVKKVGNDETILWTSPQWVTEGALEGIYDTVRYTPQLIVNSYLSDILSKNDTQQLKILESTYARK